MCEAECDVEVVSELLPEEPEKRKLALWWLLGEEFRHMCPAEKVGQDKHACVNAGHEA